MKAQKVKNAVIVPAGREGRLRRQAAAAPIPPQLRAEVEACYRLFIGGLLDVTDNLVDGDGDRSCRRRRSCATTATIRTSSSRPTRAPPRSPTSPTRSRCDARLLARRRVRVGRRARLRPQGDGHHRPRRVGVGARATSATSTSIPTATTSPWSASATCRATCSATACCSREHIQLVAAFDHRHVFLDPDPDAASVVRGAQAAVRAAPLVVGRLRRRADLAGRRRVPAHAKSIPITPEVRAAARHRRRRRRAARPPS